MMVANLFITPFYMGVERSAVVALIPKVLLPFNATKSVLNASLTLCLYKPLTRVLKAAGFGKAKTDGAPSGGFNARSVLVFVIGGAIAAVSLLIIFLVLGGTLKFN
jgi:hypothetical protein